MPQIDAESQRIRRLSGLFQVLSDETRLKIIQALEKRELCVSDIAKRVGVSQPAVSHQLSTLRQTDLVRERRVGQRIYYRIADARIFCIIRDGLDHVKEER
jgi:DNA-binding transcriptional ArsR family regulator